MPDIRSAKAQTYRRLYRTARWRDTRKRQLAKQPLCQMCLSQGRTTPATVCDHDDPKVKETEEGFFAGPFTSLCKTHHDSTKQRQERRGHIIGCDESGMPLDPDHHWHR